MPPTKSRNQNSFQAAPHVLHTRLDDETVLLELKEGTYFKLNPVAAHLWSELRTPRTFAYLRHSVLIAFDASEEEAARDVEDFLAQLQAHALLLTSDAS